MPKQGVQRQPHEHKAERLTDAEVEKIRSRRPAIRATLACEGLYLTKEEEALLDQMEDEHLNQEQRDERVLAFLEGGHEPKSAP